MASTINLSLTDELRSFIDSNCGDTGLYATPSEFLRDLLREKKERQEAAALRIVLASSKLTLCFERLEAAMSQNAFPFPEYAGRYTSNG